MTIGQQRDKDGIVRMWWSQQSQAEFNRRAQCFINQYSQYNYLGVQVRLLIAVHNAVSP